MSAEPGRGSTDTSLMEHQLHFLLQPLDQQPQPGERSMALYYADSQRSGPAQLRCASA